MSEENTMTKQDPSAERFAFGEQKPHMEHVKMLTTIKYGQTPLKTGKKYRIPAVAAQQFVSRGLAQYVKRNNPSGS